MSKNEKQVAAQEMGAAAFLRGDLMMPARDKKLMVWMNELFPNAKIGDSGHNERLELYDNWTKGYIKAQDAELKKLL